ncbi:hypothetical protein M8494_05860 [Serratia ureilytica]
MGRPSEGGDPRLSFSSDRPQPELVSPCRHQQKRCCCRSAKAAAFRSTTPPGAIPDGGNDAAGYQLGSEARCGASSTRQGLQLADVDAVQQPGHLRPGAGKS